MNYIPIVLATFIEPFWLILNRLLCLLQPYEQLRRGNANASPTIELDYSSLPPQFLLWREVRAKHWLIFLLCLMVLFANALSVALSGLMYEGTQEISRPADFEVPRTSQFVKLDGLGLPFNTKLEGNWQDGTTSDQLYRLMSNLTAGIPLPSWVDDDYTYSAVDTGKTNISSTVKVRTNGYGAFWGCRSLDQARGEQYTLKFNDSASNATLEVLVRNNKSGSLAACRDNESKAVVSYRILDSLRDLQSGHLALELATMLTSNNTKEDDLFCGQHILAGWIRADLEPDGDKLALGLQVMNITFRKDAILVCQPTIETISAELIADSAGLVQRQVSKSYEDPELLKSFDKSSAADLIAQVHQFLPDVGATWHTDSNSSDFNNYLIGKSTGVNSMLDASLPVPTAAYASK